MFGVDPTKAPTKGLAGIGTREGVLALIGIENHGKARESPLEKAESQALGSIVRKDPLTIPFPLASAP